MKNARLTIKTGGMVCRACAGAIEARLLQTRGVISAEVSYRRSEAEIEYDPELTNEEMLAESIESAGYSAGKNSISGLAVDIICFALTGLLVWLLTLLPANPMTGMMRDTMGFGYIFLLGLISSAHCVCMCGGIMLSQTADTSSAYADKRIRKAGIFASLAYNGGRALSYTLMGASFGLLGTAISYGNDISSLILTMAGLLVSLIGLNMWGLFPGLRALSPQQSGACRLPAQARKKAIGRPLLAGLLTGLMPCGPLYAMWVYAVGSGSAASGAAAMLAFALGSVPLMLIFGAFNSFIPAKLTKYANRLSSMLVLAMGAKMLLKGLLASGII